MPQFDDNRIGVGGSLIQAPALPSGAVDTTAFNQGVARLGRGVDAVAGALLQREARIKEARDKRDLEAGKVDALRGLTAINESLRNTTDFKGAPGRWRDTAAKAKGDFLAGYDDPEMRAHMANIWDLTAAHSEQQFMGQLHESEAKYSVAVFEDKRADLISQYKQGRTPQERDAILQSGYALADAVGALAGPDVAQKLKTKLYQDADYGLLRDQVRATGGLDLTPERVAHLPEDMRQHLTEEQKTWAKTAGEQQWVEKIQAQGQGIEQQIRLARANAPVQLREGVESRLWADHSHRTALREQTLRDAERGALNQVVGMLTQGKAPGEVMSFIENAPSLTPAKKFEWRQYVVNWGQVRPSDPAAYNGLVQDIVSGKVADDLPILRAYAAGSITEKGKDQLIQLQKQAGGPLADDLKAANQQIGDAFKKSIMAEGTPEQAEAERRARQELTITVQQMQEAGKGILDIRKAIGPEAVTEIIRRNTLTAQQQLDAARNKQNPMPTPAPAPGPAPKANTAAAWPSAGVIVDAALALRLLNEAGGDRDKARALARQKGYVISPTSQQ